MKKYRVCNFKIKCVIKHSTQSDSCLFHSLGPVNVDMNSFFGDDAVPRYDRDIDIKQEISDLSQPVPEVSQAEEKQTDEHDEMNGDGSNLAPFGSDIAKE